uniref:Cation-transporting P-type ATPase C-terminal domain-containing protein n=1 Tax=Ditylenchus dipsaci TaxID=166011 RepID=A0A915EHW1_9BILA
MRRNTCGRIYVGGIYAVEYKTMTVYIAENFCRFMLDRVKRLASADYWKNVAFGKDRRKEAYIEKPSAKKPISHEPEPSSSFSHVFQELQNLQYSEHSMTLEQLVDIYPLSRINAEDPLQSRGLNDDEVRSKLVGGKHSNRIHPWTSKRYRLQIFFGQFLNTFRLLLLMAAIICTLIFALDHTRTNELAMGVILFGTLLFMCWIGFMEQKKTLKQISGFQTMIPTQCSVLRQGRELRISATELVIGDLVWIRTGDRVPADVRLISSEGLHIETSWISGDLEPLAYTHQQSAAGMGVFEAQNVAFSGSSCISGQGLAVVIRIGAKTLIGRLIELMGTEKRVSSCLEVEHHRFVRFITIFALSMATLTFLFGLAVNQFDQLVNTFINGFLIVMVANVPQGLPVTLTAQLLIVGRRLWKKCGGMICKHLDMADTLGMSSVIMTDKSAVLTSAVPTLTDLWIQGKCFQGTDFTISSSLKSDELHATASANWPVLDDLLKLMSLCNNAQIDFSSHNKHSVTSSGFQRRRARSRTSGRKIQPIKSPETDFHTIELVDDSSGREEKKNSFFQSLHSLKHTRDLKEKSVKGRDSDVALIKFVEQICSAQQIRDSYEVVYEMPFSPYRRYHLVIVSEIQSLAGQDEELVNYRLLVKGAPEELICNCTDIVGDNGEVQPITDEHVQAFEEAYLKLGNFADALFLSSTAFEEQFSSAHPDSPFLHRCSQYPENSWCFLGMAALGNPPKLGISEAVQKVERAGIRLFFITGDHPTTAEAIASQIGFPSSINKQEDKASFSTKNLEMRSENAFNEEEEMDGESDKAASAVSSGYSSTMQPDLEKATKTAVSANNSFSSNSSSTETVWRTGIDEDDFSKGLLVVHGDSLKDMSRQELHQILSRKHVVFARTTPSIKLELVKQCQNGPRTEIVTMSGDGLMDAVALKQADIGIAAEAGGSVFAKEASDIVVIDNSLENLVKAVEETRLLFDNLKKTIATACFPLGLTSLQVLTIDLLTEIPPSIALIFEPAERDVMRQRPRKPKARLVTPSLLFYSYFLAGSIVSVGCVLAYFTVFWHYGFSVSDLFLTSDSFWHLGAGNLTSSSGQVFNSFQQVDIRVKANAAWHISLVCSQAAHLFTCTTRRVSLFRHGVRNWLLVVAVAFEIAFLLFLLFTPAMQSVILLLVNEVRKYYIRRQPKHPIVKLFKW